MAKFKFRLATLERLRGTARDQRRAELAQAYRAGEILQQRRQCLDDDLAQLTEHNRAAAGPGAIDVDCLLEASRYELVLKSQQQLIDQQQQALETEIQRRRQALLEADRDVRVLEKLRQKQLDRHRREEARHEAKQLDEVATRRSAQEGAR